MSKDEEVVWSPSLRRIMSGIAGIGAIETGYLTYAKVFGGNGSVFCGNSQASVSSCDQVLNGPYANLPFLENVPLAALGFVAYASVGLLALQPTISSPKAGGNDDDTSNRILLTALTTSMATFSIFLMTLLFGVLQANCPYCVLSAACSFLLANIALIGGCLPEDTPTKGGKTVATGFAGAIVGAVLLFASGSVESIHENASFGSSTLVTTLNGSQKGSDQQVLYAPPEITTDSSERALAIGKALQDLGGAKMYGAHWCSHCYDQKQILGKQVFDKQTGFVEYIECSKDGINSQSKVCKAKEIPGYPTWEIQGSLFPGQQELDELEDLVKGLSSQ